MAVKKIKTKIASTDGVHTLSGVVYVPEGEIKGVFHVLHGMTEYIGRYDRFMTALAEKGFLAFGYDHLGHGSTVSDKSELGFIAHKNGWSVLVDDAGKFADEIRKQYGEELPFILFGHSMGSFVARLAAARFDKHDRLIAMGTGGPTAAVPFGIALASIIKTFKGERHISRFIEKMIFGPYNKKFEHRTAHDWLSRSEDVIAKYEQDELCMFHFSISAICDLLRLTKNANSGNWFSSLDKKKPVLLLSGSDDPVGNYGKGVEAVYKKLKAAGVDAALKLYKGYRHEILNDTSFEEVFSDISKFIGA